MFEKDVTYIDFNGKPHNETLRFHMMRPDFAKLEYSPVFKTSFSDYVNDMMSSGEGQKVYTVFELLVASSFGRRSEDGSRFVKKPEFVEEFFSSNAWDQFFIWLTEPEADGTNKNGPAFFNGIFPKELQDQMQAELEKSASAPMKPIAEMSTEELRAALAGKKAANE